MPASFEKWEKDSKFSKIDNLNQTDFRKKRKKKFSQTSFYFLFFSKFLNIAICYNLGPSVLWRKNDEIYKLRWKIYKLQRKKDGYGLSLFVIIKF